ncbi:hypothetical protein CI610_01484 [invertebrate metagenome]|uniref:Uncharacterized protein n=1 Tax=invertebrate metagenome TaxID=1711999 RepID=A0A2H9T8J9_9ZZZZ
MVSGFSVATTMSSPLIVRLAAIYKQTPDTLRLLNQVSVWLSLTFLNSCLTLISLPQIVDVFRSKFPVGSIHTECVGGEIKPV